MRKVFSSEWCSVLKGINKIPSLARSSAYDNLRRVPDLNVRLHVHCPLADHLFQRGQVRKRGGTVSAIDSDALLVAQVRLATAAKDE